MSDRRKFIVTRIEDEDFGHIGIETVVDYVDLQTNEKFHTLLFFFYEKIRVDDILEEFIDEETQTKFLVKKIDFNDLGKAIEPKIMKLINHKNAFHILGYIGRPESKVNEYILVHNEKQDYFIGHFLEGFGLVHVHFRKYDCVELTKEEEEKIKNMRLRIV